MWMIAWAQKGAMIAFWLVGFFLIVSLFLPFFAILFALLGKLMAGMRGDEEYEEYDELDEEAEGHYREGSGKGANAFPG